MLTLLVTAGVVGAVGVFILGYLVGKGEGIAVADDRWRGRVVQHQEWGTLGWQKYADCCWAKGGPPAMFAALHEMDEAMPASLPHTVGWWPWQGAGLRWT